MSLEAQNIQESQLVITQRENAVLRKQVEQLQATVVGLRRAMKKIAGHLGDPVDTEAAWEIANRLQYDFNGPGEGIARVVEAARKVLALLETQPDFSAWPLLTASDYTEFAELDEAVRALDKPTPPAAPATYTGTADAPTAAHAPKETDPSGQSSPPPRSGRKSSR